MIMPLVDTLSRVGSLKETMLMMMIFLQVRIFKISMKIFKALSRMMKNFPQVRILNAMKMIMSMVDTMLMMIFLQMRILKVLMMMMKFFLLVRILMELIVLRVMMIFLQVNIFMEDPMTLVRMVIIFVLSLIFLLSMNMTMDLGIKIMFSIIQLQQIKGDQHSLIQSPDNVLLDFVLVMRKFLLGRMIK
jgi:hypothetical protein